MEMLFARVPRDLRERLDRYVEECAMPEMTRARAVRMLLDSALTQRERRGKT
jgi:hypothetical protein